jgi:hypothetical protein
MIPASYGNKKEDIKDALNRKIEPNWERLYFAAVQEYPSITWNCAK